MADTLYFVSPCYNEEDTLPVTAPLMLEKLSSLISAGRISDASRILFVDDGSADGTWDVICSLHDEGFPVSGVRLAHNSGEQNAHIAGMAEAMEHADMIISMDCDLQDDINAVDEMLDRYYEGCDIVFGVRSSRDEDSLFKRVSSKLFYRMIGRLDREVMNENENYRLMSKKAIGLFLEFGETNFFMPGLVAKVGLKTAVVRHKRFDRMAGTTKYSLRDLVRLAVDSVTCFSAAPVEILTVFAGLSFVLAVASLVVFIVKTASEGAFSVGFAVLFSLWFIAFMLLLGGRIVAEYTVRTHFEAKKRPRYQVDKRI